MHTVVSTLNMENTKPNVLAIIPARGGSKGIPNKNIADLCGKPLIVYSIHAALLSENISRVIVSTDSKDIADIAIQYGAEVPFLRPKAMAEDNASIADAITYTIDNLRATGYNPDYVIILYPTHPFRNPKHINRLVTKLLMGFSRVFTVKVVDLHTQKYFYRENGTYKPIEFIDTCEAAPARHYCRPYGLFHGYAYTGTHSGSYLDPLSDPIQLIDIDTYDDLYLANEIIKNDLFDFELT
jgi:CMP-N,N'-diacetyllegionaminic acid synthase